jgi:hypothetical protein
LRTDSHVTILSIRRQTMALVPPSIPGDTEEQDQQLSMMFEGLLQEGQSQEEALEMIAGDAMAKGAEGVEEEEEEEEEERDEEEQKQAGIGAVRKLGQTDDRDLVAEVEALVDQRMAERNAEIDQRVADRTTGTPEGDELRDWSLEDRDARIQRDRDAVHPGWETKTYYNPNMPEYRQGQVLSRPPGDYRHQARPEFDPTDEERAAGKARSDAYWAEVDARTAKQDERKGYIEGDAEEQYQRSRVSQTPGSWPDVDSPVQSFLNIDPGTGRIQLPGVGSKRADRGGPSTGWDPKAPGAPGDVPLIEQWRRHYENEVQTPSPGGPKKEGENIYGPILPSRPEPLLPEGIRERAGGPKVGQGADEDAMEIVAKGALPGTQEDVDEQILRGDYGPPTTPEEELLRREEEAIGQNEPMGRVPKLGRRMGFAQTKEGENIYGYDTDGNPIMTPYYSRKGQAAKREEAAREKQEFVEGIRERATDPIGTEIEARQATRDKEVELENERIRIEREEERVRIQEEVQRIMKLRWEKERRGGGGGGARAQAPDLNKDFFGQESPFKVKSLGDQSAMMALGLFQPMELDVSMFG